MTLYKGQNIHERIYKFVLRVLKLVSFLPKNTQNLILIDQITRSVTSMGANDQEADGTYSLNDFIHKNIIVRKEGKETNYWLHLITDTNPQIANRMKDIMQEGEEIVKIISAIIIKTKKRKQT